MYDRPSFQVASLEEQVQQLREIVRRDRAAVAAAGCSGHLMPPPPPQLHSQFSSSGLDSDEAAHTGSTTSEASSFENVDDDTGPVRWIPDHAEKYCHA